MVESRADNFTKAELKALQIEVAKLSIKLESMRDAIDLQAIEYSRRLDELNGHRKETNERSIHFVTRELFDATLSSFTVWQKVVSDQLAEMRGSRSGVVSLISIIISIVTAVSVVYTVLKLQ